MPLLLNTSPSVWRGLSYRLSRSNADAVGYLLRRWDPKWGQLWRAAWSLLRGPHHGHIEVCHHCLDRDMVEEGPSAPGATMCHCHRCDVDYYG